MSHLDCRTINLILIVQSRAATHRRSLRSTLSLSSLSAEEFTAAHKACESATKHEPYGYTKARCACSCGLLALPKSTGSCTAKRPKNP